MHEVDAYGVLAQHRRPCVLLPQERPLEACHAQPVRHAHEQGEKGGGAQPQLPRSAARETNTAGVFLGPEKKCPAAHETKSFFKAAEKKKKEKKKN